jgi:hypothetical protein
VLDRDCLEAYSLDQAWFIQWQGAPILNGKAVDQIPCLPGRIDGTPGTFGQASSMIGMRMRQDYPCQRHAVEPT